MAKEIIAVINHKIIQCKLLFKLSLSKIIMLQSVLIISCIKNTPKERLDNLIIKFLDLIMTNEHKDLAKSLAVLVKKHQKESKLVYNHDVKIYDVKKKSDLIRNISEITDDFSYIDFITDDKLAKEDLYNFLAYSRAYFLTLKK